ncbi:hypothetical protein ACQJBY_062709 [Aegilops geniculata]
MVLCSATACPFKTSLCPPLPPTKFKFSMIQIRAPMSNCLETTLAAHYKSSEQANGTHAAQNTSKEATRSGLALRLLIWFAKDQGPKDI